MLAQLCLLMGCERRIAQRATVLHSFLHQILLSSATLCNSSHQEVGPIFHLCSLDLPRHLFRPTEGSGSLACLPSPSWNPADGQVNKPKTLKDERLHVGQMNVPTEAIPDQPAPADLETNQVCLVSPINTRRTVQLSPASTADSKNWSQIMFFFF